MHFTELKNNSVLFQFIMFIIRAFSNYFKIILGCAFLFFFTSCKTTKQSGNYFETLKKDTSINKFLSASMENIITQGDVLNIVIRSLSVEESGIYNTFSTGAAQSTGYLVDKAGNIRFIRLGTIKAEGKTRKELAAEIETRLLPYLKEPVADVTFQNHRVTIMGSVTNPQVLLMPEERISILDAIALSGDLKEDALKNNILIIRDSIQHRVFKHIDLQDLSIFSSEWFYLQPNDVLYVSSDFTRKQEEQKRQKLQTNLSLLASGVSLLVIIIDRIIR